MDSVSDKSDKVSWLASQIFSAYPKDVTAMKFYTLGCGCLYYQRLLPDGDLDSEVGIYRDGEDGPCEVCMHLEKDWEDRVIDKVVVYKTDLQIDAKL